jgi:glycosyltransferase involved in cell wall biosynthesis
VILYAGKLTPRKRAADLLDAYVLLSPDRKREPDPYLLIVGDGETRSELETQVSTLGWNSVRFLGFRNQSELPQLYDLCDIFVLPSFGEPWGLVVNEAMNAGRAVIVSDQVGCGPDLVKDGVNGKIFPAGDVDRLYASLEAVLRDRRYIDMGRKSLEIIDGWGYEQDVAGLLETMHSLENSQNRPSYEQRPGD